MVPNGGAPANDTALRSGSGRLRLGRLGSGGKPAGRGIRPTTTHTQTQYRMRACFHYSFIYYIKLLPRLTAVKALWKRSFWVHLTKSNHSSAVTRMMRTTFDVGFRRRGGSSCHRNSWLLLTTQKIIRIKRDAMSWDCRLTGTHRLLKFQEFGFSAVSYIFIYCVYCLFLCVGKWRMEVGSAVYVQIYVRC